MGRTTSFRKNFRALGFRSPAWRIANYFARKEQKESISPPISEREVDRFAAR